MDIEKVKAIIFFTLMFVNLLAAYLVWREGKSKPTFYLGWVFFFYATLCFSWAGVYFFDSHKVLWTRAHWIGGFMLINYYLIFVYYFTDRTRYIKLKIIVLNILGLSMSYAAMTTPYFMTQVDPYYPYLNSASTGSLNILIAKPYVLFLSCLGLYYLIKAYYKETGFKKWQIKYFILGASLATIGGAIFSGLWPLFNRDSYNPIINEVTPYASIFLVIFTVYAVLKNNLFEIKLALTELLTLLIGLVLFFQIILAPSEKTQLINLVIFLFYLIIGYLLVRSTHVEIKKEIEAEKLANDLSELNKNLEKKVEEKTLELRENIQELCDSKKALLNILEDMEKARNKTEEEKNKTLAIIANFTDPIIVLNKYDKISMINPSAERVFGLSEDDLDVLIIDEDNYSLENFRTVINKNFTVKKIDTNKKDNFSVTEEMTLHTETQPIVFKVITAQVLGSNNEFLGTMKIFYDLTREKIIDKLKSDFITVAAHQMRTPLSAIKWAIKLVLDGDAGAINKEQQKLLYQGYRSNERVIVLINDMLNVSRIEEGRFGYNFSVGDFHETLNLVLEDAEYQLKTKKIELIQKVPDGALEINMDKEKIVLVLQNLVENAINYTPESGKIEVAVEYGKNFLTFKIKDNGVGIPEKDKVKLFSKFFRADNVMRMQTEGSGLGLFISKNIIEQHRGEIHCQSTEGKGTEFNIVLPVK